MSEHYDVVVAGGGSAGVAAALSAARSGARTLLVERYAQLGGMGSNALVHTLCGLYHPDVSKPAQWLNPGLPTEIGERMLERTGQSQPDLMGRVYVLRHHPTLLAEITRELCEAEPALTLWLRRGIDSITGEESGWSLMIDEQRVTSAAVIDTTGDALLARMIGLQHWQIADSAQLYRPSYVAHFAGVAAPLDERVIFDAMALIARSVSAGTLSESALGSTLRSAPDRDEVFLTIDLEAGKDQWNPLVPARQQLALAEARDCAQAVWEQLRAMLPAFAKAEPLQHPVHLGVRESACWKGDVMLKAKDLISCRRFDDEVALAGWPLEMRETARGPKFRYFDKPEPAGIPAGCLRTRVLPGMFFAGRCLSADHEALASVRVMGTCLATGQAAGGLAAEFVGKVARSCINA